MKTQQYSLYTLPPHYQPEDNTLWELDPALYSRFKHGCEYSIAAFSDAIAEFVIKSCPADQRIYIAPSAYQHVPTAAGLLVGNLEERNLLPDVFQYVKLTRNKIITDDYATLDSIERQRAMQDIRIDFDTELLHNQTLLIIDDSYVTGTHENILKHHLTKTCATIIFVYLVDMKACEMPNIEMQMNNFEIKRLYHMYDIMNSPNFMINSRVLKMIFNSPINEFIDFVTLLSPDQQSDIYNKAIMEGYMYLGSVFETKLKLLNNNQLHLDDLVSLG
ncbi:phosphoribosyltransferase family protein [Reichenbachiella agarivorans]|uniref:Phosphoribosyltransferase family protein n=1 Tax=Reichenbachiella agarivorans TaxID=2979464 RepID=A0ABY6CQG7_9BACT|nr:phosphoribosyltransferase family protein [Reichenbachiella agarivorans]UXP31688.1 phosphoribosyltransferase family protein [Reichenbachiella agarivorans]